MSPFKLTPLALALALPTGWSYASTPTTHLDTLVVSATGYEQSMREAPASIHVVTRDQLEQSQYSSLADALADVEGVDVGASAGKTGGLNISLRGMPSEYTLILIDGQRQNPAGNVTPNGFGETATRFMPPLAAIERIEVIRGPMSTLYGSDAMGGIINIITRPVSNEWRGTLGFSSTYQFDEDFGNEYRTQAYLSGPLIKDKLGLTLRGQTDQRQASDLRYPSEAGEQVEVSKRGPSPVEAETYSVGGRLTFKLNPQQKLWLDVESARQTYDNSEGQLGTLGVRGYADELKFNRDQYLLAHQMPLAQGQLETRFTYNQTETLGRIVPSGLNKGQARTLETENRIADIQWVGSRGAHWITLGGQYWDAQMQDGVAPNAFDHQQGSIFVEDEWHLHDDFNLTLGLRYDDHSTFGGHTSPRVYGVWTLAPAWTLKGGVSGGYKTPRLDQLADGIVGFGGQGTIPLIGSPDLEPETSISSELGLYYQPDADLSASVTLFNNEFEDKIASGAGLLNCSYANAPNRAGCVDYGHWPDLDTYGNSINVDEAVTRGLELSSRWQFAPAWQLQMNYTYTDSEQKSGAQAGQPLTDTPEHMLNAKLQWQVTPSFATWLKAEYRSERYRAVGRGFPQEAKDQLGDYRAYTLVHLGTSFAITPSVRIQAALYNLLDKDFVEYSRYLDASGNAAYTSNYPNHEDARRLWLSLNVDF
ncbi:outer membrane receptor for ferrienterochelin and colicins [Allopseudospirillum japonicum]|uniref:Outer membrane receptor for ferrienterochelin and colicins n=1 Tax=Allopseudospirillum japonicum TaxID=64971 RepID=A0A1H6R2V8_9GAMM|nr:TonB-dependent receptor [Allopseudospirillum japonicum]SEI50189.1 outer membrane receptor for ferrienterochelin and colicins [Allopseudospirillum japonicum]